MNQIVEQFKEKVPTLKEKISNLLFKFLYEQDKNGILYLGCLKTLHYFGPKIM